MVFKVQLSSPSGKLLPIVGALHELFEELDRTAHFDVRYLGVVR
jgi:hypothetical protein